MASLSLQHYKSTKIRIVAASLAGSAILSIYLCIPVRHYLWVRLVFYLWAYVSMAVIAFPGNRKWGLLRCVIILYLVSFLVNGIFRWLSLKIHHTGELLGLCILVYLAIRGTYFFYLRKKEKEQHIYGIRIVYNKQLLHLKGLWDTGNLLRSPYHQRGVSVCIPG